MAKLARIFAVLALSGWAFGDQIASTSFKGLNNNESSVIIPPEQAQDLLNVDVSPGGKSVKKRSGFGVYKALGTGQALHGGFHAYDNSGNDYQLWGSSTSLYGIVNDGTPIQLVSSATLNSTWDCADTQQNSYCVNSNRNAYIRTNGTTMSWFTSPLGTMVESTPDRIVVAGVSGSPNTLFVSQSNTFTNFTTGTNATDAFTEVIAGPGSKITHIRWGCGKLLWWKDQSFGYFDFDDQFVAQVKVVSDVIGTFDNTSAIDPGGRVWFRGQDGHSWVYDCSVLEKQSVDITPNIQLSGKRIANSWTQSTATEFNNGVSTPSVNVSTTAISGDVIFNGIFATETSSTQWNSGSANGLTVGVSSISLTLNNSGTISDPSFEGTFGTNFIASGNGSVQFDPSTGGNCTINPHAGSQLLRAVEGTKVITSRDFQISIIDASTLVGISTTTISAVNDCAWYQGTHADNSSIGKRVKFNFCAHVYDGSNFYNCARTKSSYIFGGSTSLWTAFNRDGTGTEYYAFDDVSLGSSTATSGSFTSQIYDTGFSSSTVALSSFSWTANTSTPTFSIQTSTGATGPFATLTSSSGTFVFGNRYVRYVTTISITSSDNALTSITAAVLARSTGTYYSTVRNAPNLTTWSTLGVNSVNNGGSHAFYMRSSTNSINVLQSTPSWTSVSAGALITITTGTYFQFRDDFSITNATQTPTLNDFTVNWFEGTAGDQAYMLYFDNAIWESVPFGVGQSTNNYIFKYDLINDGWTLYNFGAGGMLVQGNRLYFGDTSASNVFNFGTATSDNGTAINAYWKSKDFSGPDPFLQTQLTNLDTFATKNQGTTLTVAYTTDTSTTTSYSMDLSNSTQNIIQSRKLLPSGKLGQVFNVKYSDTSTSSAWEILGFRIGFTQLPYRSTP